MAELREATVLVTGASSGLGAALAIELGRQGARLALAARRAGRLERTAQAARDAGAQTVCVYSIDLGTRGSAAQFAGQAEADLGPPDVLVNNAGGGVGGAIWAVGDGDAVREAFEVNFWTPLALVAAVVPGMRERGRGTVVNVTSAASGMVWPGFGAYASTKAALSVATDSLRSELTGSGVAVLEVVPGPVDTPIQGETRLLPGIDRMLELVPLGSAAVLAQQVITALQQDRQRVFYPPDVEAFVRAPIDSRDQIAELASEAAAELGPETIELILGSVVRTGSHGDPMLVEAREAWERSHPSSWPPEQTAAPAE